MKKLIIVGAGGMGRKLYECVRKLNCKNKRWEIIGFIDDNLNTLQGKKCDLEIIGTIKEWTPKKSEVFVMGISDPYLKKKLSNQIKEKGGEFETIISPDVILGDYVNIGEGSVIMTPYNVESGAKIGRFVTLLGSTIALDGEIGDYSTTTGFVNLTNSKLGSEVFVGSHAVILENVNVGDRAVICVGSIVMQDVESDTKVIGYPARTIEKMNRRFYNGK
ncbi:MULTISPECIES: sugar O-acyltransferase [Eubacterium]|uniref:PglD-related sugar-binding protein n=1 Tax=Eubacterium TaxID=1730 RepID=UPI0015A46753|nr:sugar O-acyltransferase [Eubacterium barkeri]